MKEELYITNAPKDNGYPLTVIKKYNYNNIQCTANNTATSQCLLNIPVNKPVDDQITPVNVDQGDIRGPKYYSPRISENLKQLKKL